MSVHKYNAMTGKWSKDLNKSKDLEEFNDMTGKWEDAVGAGTMRIEEEVYAALDQLEVDVEKVKLEVEDYYRRTVELDLELEELKLKLQLNKSLGRLI